MLNYEKNIVYSVLVLFKILLRNKHGGEFNINKKKKKMETTEVLYLETSFVSTSSVKVKHEELGNFKINTFRLGCIYYLIFLNLQNTV